MPFSNLPVLPKSETATYFETYFDRRFNIDVNLYDAAIAVFEKQTGNRAAAETIATALIQAAKERAIDLEKLLDDFKKMSNEDVNRYLITVLNLTRKNTSYLGFRNEQRQSGYVTRTILP